MTLVDTGPLVALIDKTDKETHRKCHSATYSLSGPMLTSWACLTEAMYLLGELRGWKGQLALWRYLEKGALVLHSSGDDEWRRVRELMEQYQDTPMDLADASLALRLIAEALAKAGMATEAREAATEALAAAREIEGSDSRAIALMTVADFWLDQGQYNEVWNLLEEAQVAVNKVFNDKQRSEVMRRLAVILARLHSYRAARETAEECSRSSDRLAAYTAILCEYHIERDPSLARLFAGEKEEEEED